MKKLSNILAHWIEQKTEAHFEWYLKTMFRNLAGFKKSCIFNFNRSKKYQEFGRYFESICMNFTCGSSSSFASFTGWDTHANFQCVVSTLVILNPSSGKTKERMPSLFTINSLSLSAIDLKWVFSTVYRQ